MFNLETVDGRKSLINFIESKENGGRKAETYQQSEVYNDRIKPYVIGELRKQFSEASVQEMPIVSSMNVCKRVVNQQATIYNEAPIREWTDLDDKQSEVAWEVYHQMRINKKLSIANKYFKLHKQCLLQIVPQNGKLVMRVFHPYQWDYIPNQTDPEVSDGYIISAYNKVDELRDAALNRNSPSGYITMSEQKIRQYEQELAMTEESKQMTKTYTVWTKTLNFVMNIRGEIIGEPLPNPLANFGITPYIEFSEEKEFEYWVRQASALTEFTIEFNARLSETAQIVKMQGFAQAWMKGPLETIMESIQIGPNYVLKLVNDKGSNVETEFGFATPQADISGAISFLEVQLSGFLSSQGIDPKSVTIKGESQQYASGLERLLALIEKMSATKSDYDLFQHVETQVWNLVKAWLTVLNGTSTLDRKYWTSIPEDSEIIVKYAKPENVESELEKLTIAEKRIDLGLSSPINELMESKELSREDAEELYDQYQLDATRGLNGSFQNQTITREDLSES